MAGVAGSGCGAPKGHPPYPGCETGGRPTKYTDEFIEKEAEAIDEWMNRKDSIWFEDFAFERGYCPDYISEWAAKNEKFNRAYKRLVYWQKSTLIKRGLCKKYQYNLVQLLLGHQFGIFPKAESKISGDSQHPLDFMLTHVNGNSKDLIPDA